MVVVVEARDLATLWEQHAGVGGGEVGADCATGASEACWRGQGV